MLFFYQTKKSYSNHLYELYITQDMSKQETANLIGSYKQIENHLSHYYITKTRNKEIEGIYVNTPSDIADQYVRPFIDIVHEYIDKGYSPTEITMELKLKSGTYVSGHLKREKERQELAALTEDDYILPSLKGISELKIEQRFKDELNIDLKEWLYNKHIVEGLSGFEIAKILGTGIRKVENLFHRYNIHKSKEQVRQDSIWKGLIDYQEINLKSRKTRNKSVSKSNKQDVFRELIKYYLQCELNNNELIDTEIVIGANEWGILHNKEVDIAIIVLHNDNTYKYAIEYNNENWHDEKRDQTKESELINKGWVYYYFDELRSVTASMVPMEQRSSALYPWHCSMLPDPRSDLDDLIRFWGGDNEAAANTPAAERGICLNEFLSILFDFILS